MLLLTNLKGTKSFKSLWQVVEGYITRWRVEETIRYIKQSYRLEDMRVLSYERLKNMAALVLCTAHFAASWMGFGERHKILTSHVVDLSQRINKTPEFYYYAVADGIRRLFTRFGQGWRRDREKPPDPIENRQMPSCKNNNLNLKQETQDPRTRRNASRGVLVHPHKINGECPIRQRH